MTWVLSCTWQVISGHGMMIEPTMRSSLWRFAGRYPGAPANYDDNALECGGKAVMYHQNGGRCGVCGDPYNLPQPRPNEAGGRYANGVIARTYRQGDVIDVVIRLTDNLLGYFFFKLCPNNDVTRIVTQECLDAHNLQVVDNSGQLMGEKYVVPSERTNGDHSLHVQLPSDVTCSQCVLQWTYHAGNAWGCDPDGTCGKGLGEQEIFVNCADIAVTNRDGGVAVTTQPTTTLHGTSTTVVHVTTSQRPHLTTTAAAAIITAGHHQGSTNCHDATGSATANMDGWCATNCAGGFCPAQFCTCD